MKRHRSTRFPQFVAAVAILAGSSPVLACGGFFYSTLPMNQAANASSSWSATTSSAPTSRSITPAMRPTSPGFCRYPGEGTEISRKLLVVR